MKKQSSFYDESLSLWLPEHYIKQEQEAQDHCNNYSVGSETSISCNFLQSSRTQLEFLRFRPDMVTLLFHHADLALVFKHASKITPHLVSNSIQSLLYFVSFRRLCFF